MDMFSFVIISHFSYLITCISINLILLIWSTWIACAKAMRDESSPRILPFL